MLHVLAPVAGTVLAMTDVPDPVFSASLVGPGVAVVPDAVAGRTAVAPVAGRVLKLHPHAFIIASDAGPAVLVHLGIDTVELRGEGFTLLVAQGDEVAAGQPVATWDPADVEAGGRSPVVPVIALEAAPDAVREPAAAGTAVTVSDVLFSLDS